METITLNLIPTGVRPVCHVSQNDNERAIKIKLVDGSIPYSIKNGDTISINIRKPDLTVVSSSIDATVGNSYVDVEITDNMCDINGQNLCELRIINGNTRISTSNFFMEVEVDPSYVPTPPTPPVPSRRGGLYATEMEIISTTYETA